MMRAGRVMQHAPVGYRDLGKSRRAYRGIWEACAAEGVTVDRYGLCLDWSMALPRDIRARGTRGTGMILDRPEDFAALTSAAPVAPHFGDFVLGLPAAVENTATALAAGSRAIGNLGQYFTFRIPGWEDDVLATQQTVRAIGLIAAQPVLVIVHSKIDDGYAALFTNVASCFGMILLERTIVEDLMGATIGHCYGHHFSDPLIRLAFQRALAASGPEIGTLIYGNTVSYRGAAAPNFASLASYMLVDVVGQRLRPSGHAVNAVPVTENSRIPEIDKIVGAQLFAGRLIEHAADYERLFDLEAVDGKAAEIVAGGEAFKRSVLDGLAGLGVRTDDPFELLLALRRLGARGLEARFGV